MILAVLLALLVLLIASGAALALLHLEPNLPFYVLSKLHVLLGILFVPLGVWYLAAHTLRIGAPWTFLPWLVVWVVVFFCLFFIEVPFQAATIIGILLGGVLAAWLWWRSRRGYAWQSYATAVGVMLALGGVIDTGYVMAAGWTSMRTTFYHWTHLALTPAVPLLMWAHARARRRRTPSSAAYRLPRVWYATVAGLLVVQAGWVAYQTRSLARAVPQDLSYRTMPQASVHIAKEQVTLVGSLDPELFQASRSCAQAECHVGPYRQWHGSAHRFASQTVAYLRASEAFVARRGRDAEMFCATCHNPLAVASGAYARQDWSAVKAYARDGVSCEGCHFRAPPLPQYGRFSANFRIERDTPFPWVPDRADLDDLRRGYLNQDAYFHRRKYFHEYMHSSEMCGACHGEHHVDVAGNDVVMFDELLGWQRSELEKRGVTCQKCHNNLDAYPHLEEKSMHARPDHVFPGIALDLPEAIPNDFSPDEPFLAEDLRETADFLRLFLDGDHKVSDWERNYLHLIRDTRINAFEDYVEHRKVLDMSATIKPAGDGAVVLTVTSTNHKVGHDFPSGPPDLSQYWLEVLVQVPQGEWHTVIGCDPITGAIDPRAPRLGGSVFDTDGNELSEHAIDRVARVELSTIGFERALVHEIVLRSEEAPAGAKVRAQWRYRRYKPAFSRWAWRDEMKVFPSHRLATVELQVPGPLVAAQ
ncbi:MAG: hypothetical protein HY270_15325 [Deltaproteobacteria bacterium]|nr:hypothetical protein [Deltaproteobacteria bacterium]